MSSAEDHKLLANSSPENGSGEPEELPIELEDSQASKKIPKLALKTHMVAQEVRVRVTGAHPGKSAAGRELFDEETASILISENGGVITLRAAVAPGQLLFLENVESKREVVGQVIRKRAHRPTSCYVELEFTEPARGFWGMEFSAATALLPKDATQREAAEMVISAEATDDEPEQRAAAPAAEEVQALKREVEALRQQLKQMQPEPVSAAPTPDNAPSPIASAPLAPDAPLDLAVAPPPAPPQATRTMEIPRSAVYVPVAPPPSDYAPIAEEAAPEQVPPERVRVYEPAADLAVPSPKVKRFRRPSGNFTPAFRTGALRFGLFAGALVLTIIGAASYQHWSPWSSTAKIVPVPPTPEALTAKVSALTAKPEPAPAPVPVQSSRTAPPIESSRNPAVVSSENAAPMSARTPETVVIPPAPVYTPGVSSGRSHVGKTAPASATLTAQRAAELPLAEAFADATIHAAANDGFVPPTLIHSVRPVASLHQLYDFETGHVVIDAVVDTSGDVIATQPIAGPPSLRGPAAAAVMQFRYQPATRKGRPVATHIRVIVPFEYEP